MKSDEIFIVDDDPAVRDGLAYLFAEQGYQVTTFDEGAAFIKASRKRVPAGVILDIFLPGMSGIEVLRELDATRFPAPIFAASGRGDISLAVQAMRCGAYDFLEKQFAATTVVDRVRRGIQLHSLQASGSAKPQNFRGHELLSPREHEVLSLITYSYSSQEIAEKLLISRRTVEVHRSHILKKVGARNTVDLVRIALNRDPGLPEEAVGK